MGICLAINSALLVSSRGGFRGERVHSGRARDGRSYVGRFHIEKHIEIVLMVGALMMTRTWHHGGCFHDWCPHERIPFSGSAIMMHIRGVMYVSVVCLEITLP